MTTVAALYVQTGGAYYGIPGVDPWDQERDARLYHGPHSVIAHPPCKRWGNYWHGSPSDPHQFDLGDDGGCFAHAIAAVRAFGGVLEHPAGSRAWAHFDLNVPPSDGGWIYADFAGGWTCCVDQGNYGHRAKKQTWLYCCHVDPPSLLWGPSKASVPVENMGKNERAATPEPFRDLLISIARSVSK